MKNPLCAHRDPLFGFDFAGPEAGKGLVHTRVSVSQFLWWASAQV